MMMMRTSNVDVLKIVSKFMKNVCETVNIEFEVDKVIFTGLDKSMVEFFNIIVENDFFYKYEVREPLKIVVDSSQLSDFLNMAGKDDILEISVDEGLMLTFIGESTRIFEIKTIDLDYNQIDTPRINNSVELDLSFSMFKDMIKSSKLCGDFIHFVTTADGLICETESSGGSFTLKYDDDSVDDEVESMFNVEYLSNVLKLSKLNEELTISLGDNSPLEIIINDELTPLTIKYNLANYRLGDE